MKYQSSSTHCPKVIERKKFLKNRSNFQGHCVKNVGTQRKVLSQRILMRNIKGLALMVEFFSKVKFTEGQNYRLTDRTKTMCLLIFNLLGIIKCLSQQAQCWKATDKFFPGELKIEIQSSQVKGKIIHTASLHRTDMVFYPWFEKWFPFFKARWALQLQVSLNLFQIKTTSLF